jgi:hypothetical protein
VFRRLRTIFAILLAAALLSGCTHMFKVSPPPSRDAAMRRLQTETPCCRAWADLPFRDALPDTPREFVIDKFSPVAVLDGERTHFLTFVLPKFRHAYRVVLQTRPSARRLGNSFLLAPTITLLNANYRPLASSDVTMCVYINWRPGMSGGFGAVRIDNPDARYLVVTTSRKQLAATTYWAQSPTSFADVNVPASTVLAGIKPPAPVSSGTFNVAHGPEGRLTLGKMTPAYASAVDDGLCGKPDDSPGLLPELHHSLQNR